MRDIVRDLVIAAVASQHLDGDLPVQSCISAQIHLAHPPGAELGKDGVVSERLPHRWPILSEIGRSLPRIMKSLLDRADWKSEILGHLVVRQVAHVSECEHRAVRLRQSSQAVPQLLTNFVGGMGRVKRV